MTDGKSVSWPEPEWTVKGVNKLQGQYISGDVLYHKAAEAAYAGTQAPVEMRKAFDTYRRD